MEPKFNFIILLTFVILILCLSIAFNYIKKQNEGFMNCMNKYNNSPNVNPPWILNKEINPLVYNITLTVLKDINNKLRYDKD